MTGKWKLDEGGIQKIKREGKTANFHLKRVQNVPSKKGNPPTLPLKGLSVMVSSYLNNCYLIIYIISILII